MSSNWLIRRMQQWPNEPAIVWHDQLFTYKDVVEGIRLWRRKLNAQGVHSGNVVGLEGDYSLNTCAMLLTLIQRKAIIVPLTKAVGTHREEFFETAEVQLIFKFQQISFSIVDVQVIKMLINRLSELFLQIIFLLEGYESYLRPFALKLIDYFKVILYVVG